MDVFKRKIFSMAISRITNPPLQLNKEFFSDKTDEHVEEDSFIKPVKLTDWKNEPSVKDLKQDLEGSKELNREYSSKIENYSELRNITGNAKITPVKGRSSVQPKLIRKQAEWRYAPLAAPFILSDKLFKISPRTWEDVDSSENNEIILNYQFDIKLNKVKFIGEYVRACVNDGTAIIQVGWERETHIEKVEVPVIEYFPINPEDIEYLQELTEAVNLKVENPNSFLDLPLEIREAVDYYLETDIPVVAKQTSTEMVDQEIVDKNQPVVKIIDPKNFYIDPSCEGDINNAKFVINSFQTSKADLQATGLYKNLNLIDLANADLLNDTEFKTSTPKDYQFKDDPRKIFVAYEYWGYYDIHDNGELTCIVATWVNDILIRLEESPFPDGKPPFVTVSYMPVEKSVFGEADAELLQDNQRITGAIMRGNIDLLGRSANAQQGIAKGFLDTLNERRFHRGEDFVFNPNIPPEVGIVSNKYPEITQSSMLMLDLQSQDAESLTGIKSFSNGISGNAYGNVAAGIKGILNASSQREMDIILRLADGMKEVGLKITAMNSVFLEDEEVIRITNETFKRIRKEDLKGHFDLKVEISTTEVDQAKAQEISFMLQTMGNTVDFGVTKILLLEIAKLRRMPELVHALKNYTPEPDPVEEQLKQLSIQKAQLEVEELLSKIELNKAKAKEINSSADMQDLDFVEQQNGTKHKRNIESQQAQGEANQALAVTKGIIESGNKSFKDSAVLNNIASRNALDEAKGYTELTKALNSTT